jgi:Fe-S-cluster formation regulator IscX/YfhJ
MKNLVCIVSVLSVVFTGCFTFPGGNSGSGGSKKVSDAWMFDDNNLAERKLSKNEIVYRDNPAGLPKGVDAELFGKVSWFNSLLERFSLHESMSFEDKETLFEALFGFIPDGPTDDFYRAVAIGGYFKDGTEPLILYARVYKPSDKAPAGSKGILDFTGNFIVTQNKQTGKIDFIPIDTGIFPNVNWFSNGVIFSDNSIVKASYIYSQKKENEINAEAGDDIYLQYVNMADVYIKDEKNDNDNKILEMLNDAYNNADSLTVRLTAKLNTFLYCLYKNDVAGAEEALTIATQLSNESESIDPSFRRVVDIEAPTMLRIYKNNAAIQP